MGQPNTAQRGVDPRIGLVLEGRYKLTRLLGQGGMGAVYAADHLRVKRQVAVKVLHPQFAQKPEIVARFHREAEAAASIGHPNIVDVFDMGTMEDGAAFLVLEMLEGADFNAHIRDQGPQPLAKVVHVLAQACDALGAAHALGIVHRDVKPENLFLTPRPNDPFFVKVLDFGISKVAGGDRSLTQTGTALGTPYYMSPEQCSGAKDIDGRSDIYALGVIAFQALTGQYPFDDEAYPMLVLKICTQPPPSLLSFRPDLPSELAALVERTLSKRREDRPSTCAELRAALEPYRSFVEPGPIRIAENAPRTVDSAPQVLAESGTRPRGTVSVTREISPSAAGWQGEAHASSGSQPAPSRSPLLLAAVVIAGFALLGVVTTVAAVFSGVLDPKHDEPAVGNGTSGGLPSPDTASGTASTSTSSQAGATAPDDTTASRPTAPSAEAPPSPGAPSPATRDEHGTTALEAPAQTAPPEDGTDDAEAGSASPPPDALQPPAGGPPQERPPRRPRPPVLQRPRDVEPVAPRPLRSGTIDDRPRPPQPGGRPLPSRGSLGL